MLYDFSILATGAELVKDRAIEVSKLVNDSTNTSGALLEVSQLEYAYGAVKALKSIDLTINDAECVCVVGANGAGKTTLARVIGGVYNSRSGEVLFRGARIPRHTHQMVGIGIASVLEGRRLFAGQTVRVNLELGSYGIRGDSSKEERLAEILSLFPRLAERLNQRAGTLSGGEQQMVAIGRALMANPRLLILDEPSMGLSPKIAGEVFDSLRALKPKGLAILLVEQNAEMAFELADRVYVLQYGQVVKVGSVQEIRELDHIKLSYLGGSPDHLDSIVMDGSIDVVNEPGGV